MHPILLRPSFREARIFALCLLTCWILSGMSEAAEGGTAIEREDIDGDGEAEIILSNDYLRVVALHPASRGVEKYGTRFVWAGRIANLVFRPTGEDFILPTVGPDRDPEARLAGLGMPDQFDKRIRYASRDGDTHTLLVGVGVTGPEGDLIQQPAWSLTEEDLPGGGKAARWTQRLATPEGYGYVLTRRLILPAGTARLRMEITLENTGTRPLDTDWYWHPFWNFQSETMDPWQMVPLAVGEDRPVRTESFAVPLSNERVDGTRNNVFGWLRPDEVGERSFLATGGRGGSNPFFGLHWDFPLLRVRPWVGGERYALEPCTKIDLEPGESTRFACDAVLGTGLGGASVVRPEGALRVQPADGESWQLAWLPSRAEPGAAVTLRALGEDGRELLRREVDLPPARPDAPARVTVHTGPLPDSARLEARLSTPGGRRLEAVRAAAPEPSPGTLVAALEGAAVLLVADTASKTRAKEVIYLSKALRDVGARPRHVRPEAIPADLSAFDTVALLGTSGLEGAGLVRIRSYAEAGGGLFASGPLPTGLEAVLPVAAADAAEAEGPVSYDYFPRIAWDSGQPRAENIPAERTHLQVATPHPVTEALPLYPATHQNIARHWVRDPAPGARVLLRETRREAPILVVDEGRPRAVLLSPVYWGERPDWILWGTVGEYHRTLLLRVLGWTVAEKKP